MAYTQAGNLTLLQLLSVTGIWGITFLIGWFAAVVNQALESPRRLLPLGVFTAVYLSVVIGGAARLAFFPPPPRRSGLHPCPRRGRHVNQHSAY
jgi:apolipoprotein N-acyltransferase